MTIKNRVFVVALLVGATACQDMDVTNPNNPNRESVLKSPSDVQALVSGTFRTFFNRTEGTNVFIPMSTMADEFSTAFFDFGGLELSQEPRATFNARSPNSGHAGVWQDYYRIIAGVNTAFRAIQQGNLKVMEGGVDVTTRLRAFGKFMQGLSHGQIALAFDRGYISSETLDFETLTFEEVRGLLRPYGEVRDTAIAELKEALRLAETNTFTFPPTTAEWIPGMTITNQQFARLIHSYIARYMAYTPRTPQERAQVNWAEVITHIDAGITTDFAPVATTGIMESLYKQRASRLRSAGTPSDFMRVDYMVVGPADRSQGFRTWLNTPAANRQPFKMDVTDRRIDGIAVRSRPSNAWVGTPPATCSDIPSPSSQSRPPVSCGLYSGFHDEVAFFNPGRGTYLRSYYFYHRWGKGTSFDTGPITIMSVAEMDLLKAEALIRLNRAPEALTLINKTRVANGGLLPVTISGAPGTAPDCVPRKYLTGACGNLWDALKYEKRIETLGLTGGLPYYDGRGWGTLLDATMIHFPMPVVDVELVLGVDQVYTFGGGGPGSAPVRGAALDACPAGVAVPGC
jgi:hypothetical protein